MVHGPRVLFIRYRDWLMKNVNRIYFDAYVLMLSFTNYFPQDYEGTKAKGGMGEDSHLTLRICYYNNVSNSGNYDLFHRLAKSWMYTLSILAQSKFILLRWCHSSFSKDFLKKNPKFGKLQNTEFCGFRLASYLFLIYFLISMSKIYFYFTLKALFVLNIFKFLSWLFGHVEKRLDSKDKVSLKIYDVSTWSTNNYNTHIAQYLIK